MSQRLASPKHSRQNCCALIPNEILTQVKMSESLALPQCPYHPPSSHSSIPVLPPHRRRDIFGQPMEVVPRVILTKRRCIPLHKEDARAVTKQIPPQLFAHSQP
eukprot:3097286-Rhodomonas_salina.3